MNKSFGPNHLRIRDLRDRDLIWSFGESQIFHGNNIFSEVKQRTGVPGIF